MTHLKAFKQKSELPRNSSSTMTLTINAKMINKAENQDSGDKSPENLDQRKFTIRNSQTTQKVKL